jgi:hypothetical protein
MTSRAACVFAVLFSLVPLIFTQTQTTTGSALPRLVRFGGTAKDLNGNPMTGAVGITFALYSEQTGGAALWLETQNVTADGNGRYVAVLGSTKLDGVPAELFTSEQAHWVGVQVSGQAEQPRVLLVSTPYAFKAGDAETIGGLPPSAFVLAVPQISRGLTGEPRKTAVANSSNSAVSGSGSTNYVPLWTSSTSLGISELYQLNGEVGVGTTTPGGKLDVRTSDAIATRSNSLHAGGGTGVYGISSATTGAGVGVIGEAHSATGTAGVFNNVGGGAVLSGQSKGTAVFSVNGNGVTQVGTQSTTPAGMLNATSTSLPYAGLAATGAPGVSPSVLGTAGVDATGGSAGSSGGVGGTGVVGTGGDGGDPSAAAGIGVVGYGGSGNVGGAGMVGYGGAGAGFGAVGVMGVGADSGVDGGGIGLYGIGGANGIPGFVGGAGVRATGTGADGIPGFAGDGIYATNADGGTASTGGYAGYFSGDINVTGTIFAGTKDFKIDHPTDPANKYLLHASVESSEMMNIYSGNATLDGSGEAVVQLPAWFEAVNGDFRYQLTSIGAPGPGLYIAQEISGNRFKIAGGNAGSKVSWHVTAVRHDAYAAANPLIVEQAKSARERGYYIHPELYGAPQERGIAWARYPETPRPVKRKAPPHPPTPQQTKISSR